MSERTAKRMVAALLSKIGVSNRVAAAAMAGQFGLLEVHQKDHPATDRLS